MILVFDTETTGLPNRALPLADEQQPWLVQFAGILIDSEGVERSSVSLIVDPDGFDIPDAAARVHGITNEVARRCGVPLVIVCAVANNLIAQADTVIAHNLAFDTTILQIQLERIGRPHRFAETQGFCTMEAAAPIVNLPPTDRMLAAGFTKPKPPKLSECVRHFFDEDLVGAHDALVDCRAAYRVYRHLMTVPEIRDRPRLPEPA